VYSIVVLFYVYLFVRYLGINDDKTLETKYITCTYYLLL